MDITTFLILMIIFIIFISIGFMIQETKYKIAYYMCVVLLLLASLNIYLSIVYYIQLRNTPGVQGKIGPKGPSGAKGQTGKCSFSNTCTIDNARDKILGIATTMYSIDKSCLDTPTLTTCKDQDTLDSAQPINTQINMLEKIAYSTSMSEDDFMTKLKVCLTDSNDCMDITDY